MIYKLRNNPDPLLSATEQILLNRGIPLSEVHHYLHTTDRDIYSPLLLGEDKLKAAARALLGCIQENTPTLVIVD